MPIYLVGCKDCNWIQEKLLGHWKDLEKEVCPHCKKGVDILRCAPGGYEIRGNNSASTSPKRRFR